MHGLTAARRLLEREGVADLVRVVRAAELRVAAKASELRSVEQRIPWWERANFLHDSPDEVRAAEVRAELAELGKEAAEARRTRDEAVEGCAETSPPIGIAFQVESVIAWVRETPRIGREEGSGDDAAETVDAIGQRVLDLWLPEVELPRLAAELESVDLSAPPRSPAPIARDPRLVYAPIDTGALRERAHAAIVNTGLLAQVREELAARTARANALETELAELEAEVGMVDRLLPTQSTSELIRDESANQLDSQQRAVFEAIERGHIAVAQGLATAHPMAWVALACFGVGAALRTAGRRMEVQLNPSGSIRRVPSAYARAVSLACLKELRGAVDHAFSDLSELVWPRRAEDSSGRRDAPGPYRVAQRPDEEPTPIAKGATEHGRTFFKALDASSLRDEIRWAVVHATTLGVVERSRVGAASDVGILDRAVFWDDSEAQAREKEMTERERWHRDLVRWRAYRGLTVVEQAAGQHPFLRAGRAVVKAHLDLLRVTTPGGRSSQPRSCPAIGKDAARAQLDHAIAELCATFGGVADRGQLIEHLCARIEGAGDRSIAAPETRGFGYRELVELFASRLQDTEFVRLTRTLQASAPAASAASAEARAADAQVRLIDRINIFTDSPEERARDAAKARAQGLEATIAQARAPARELFRQAIAAHPPTFLADVGVEVGAAISAIRAESVRKSSGSGKNRRTYYVCQLRGKKEAQRALTSWSHQLVRTFGTFPCAGELLEQWIASELTAQPGSDGSGRPT